jgi:hypothetical protein
MLAQMQHSPDPNARKMFATFNSNLNSVNDTSNADTTNNDPSKRDKKYCEKHGRGAHSTDECRMLKSNANNGRASNNSARVLYFKDSDGSFKVVKSNAAHPKSFMVRNRTFTAVASNGVSNEDVLYVDSATELNLESKLSRLKRVVILTPSTAVTIVGAGNRLITMTHKGWRTIRVANLIIEQEAYYSEHLNFNLTSTQSLAECGVSTFHDADHPEGQLYLIPSPEKFPMADPVRVECTRVGDIWCIPNPFLQPSMVAVHNVSHACECSFCVCELTVTARDFARGIRTCDMCDECEYPCANGDDSGGSDDNSDGDATDGPRGHARVFANGSTTASANSTSTNSKSTNSTSATTASSGQHRQCPATQRCDRACRLRGVS